MAVDETADCGRQRGIRIAIGFAGVARGDRQMRLADAQRAVHEIGEVVVAGSQAADAGGDRITTYATGLGGRCIGAACAGNARSGQILPIDEPADCGRQRGICVAVGFAGVVRGDRQMRLADAQRAVHEVAEVVIAGGQAADAGGDRITTYATALGGRCAGAACAGNARSGQTLAVDETADCGRQPWIGIAIGFAGVARGDSQVGFADIERAVHEIAEVVIASSQAADAGGDRIASYATALGGRCTGAACAGNSRSSQILPIHKPADCGRQRGIRIAIRFAGVVRGDRQVGFTNIERAVHEVGEVVVAGSQTADACGDRIASYAAALGGRCTGAGHAIYARRSQTLAVDEPADCGRQPWIGIAIGFAGVVRGDRQMRLANVQRAVHEVAEVVVASSQAANACRDRIASYATALGGHCAGAGHAICARCG